MRLLIAASILAISMQYAPFQCARSQDPELRREDTAGDALWGLAEQFRLRSDDAGRAATLRYLTERYPSNRHVPEARDELVAIGLRERDAGANSDVPAVVRPAPAPGNNRR
jgi:hypothetical protein